SPVPTGGARSAPGRRGSGTLRVHPRHPAPCQECTDGFPPVAFAPDPPPPADDWIELSEDVLPAAEAMEWAALPQCGGVVCFAGTVRDSSEGRPGVKA